MKIILILLILTNYSDLLAQEDNVNYDSIAKRIDSICITKGIHSDIYNKNLFCFIIGSQQSVVKFHHIFGKSAIIIDSIPHILSFLYNIINPTNFTIIRKANLEIAKYEDSNVPVGLPSKIKYIETVSGYKLTDTSINFIDITTNDKIQGHFKKLNRSKFLNFVYLDHKILSQITFDSILYNLNNWTKTNLPELVFENGHYCLNWIQIDSLFNYLVSRNIKFKIESNKLKGRLID